MADSRGGVPSAVLIAVALMVVAAGGYVLYASRSAPTRTLRLADDLEVEFAFDHPVAVFIETRGAGGAYQPFGYAAIGTSTGAAKVGFPDQTHQYVRLTIGVGGDVVSADGKVMARSATPSLNSARTEQLLTITAATASAQIETERGTRLSVSLHDGVLHTAPQKF